MNQEIGSATIFSSCDGGDLLVLGLLFVSSASMDENGTDIYPTVRSTEQI